MPRPKKTDKPLTELEKDLLQSAKDMLAHSTGEKKFPSYHYDFENKINVKEVRKNLHLTQEEFANIIGASVHAVRHWENGRRTPDGTARTLLWVLKANPSAVMDALNKYN
ncbi:MAG: helix-turn-helix domain-containing protein [Rickettsiales bacterium]